MRCQLNTPSLIQVENSLFPVSPSKPLPGDRAFWSGCGQTVDLNASASSNLAVLYSVDDTSVAELAVTNQSALKAWWKLDEATGVDASDSSAFSSIGSVENPPRVIGMPASLATPSPWTEPMIMCGCTATPVFMVLLAGQLPCGLRPPRPTSLFCNTVHPVLVLCLNYHSTLPALQWLTLVVPPSPAPPPDSQMVHGTTWRLASHRPPTPERLSSM